MTINAKDFYDKLGVYCNENVMTLFHDITEYFFSSIKMENTDDIEYDFNHFDKSFYMIIAGIEDSVYIRIYPDRCGSGDADIFVEYRTRRREFESNGKRTPVFDAGQWEMNSDSCRVIEFERCTTLAHADVVQEIMKCKKGV